MDMHGQTITINLMRSLIALRLLVIKIGEIQNMTHKLVELEALETVQTGIKDLSMHIVDVKMLDKLQEKLLLCCLMVEQM